MNSSKTRREIPLILASLLTASIIWLIAKQADLGLDRLSATVALLSVPDSMIVEAPAKVAIKVQYPKELSNQVVEKNFSVPINVEDLFEMDPQQWNPPTDPMVLCYEIAYIPPARTSLDRLTQRLPFLQSLASGGKISPAVIEKVLPTIKTDLATLTNHQELELLNYH